MKKLSKRLRHLILLVPPGGILADVGTDHGYVPIALCLEHKIDGAIAMDIKEGPLLFAREHIKAYGLGGYITTRRSDGVAALKEGEADTVLIAGMGGGLMLRILKEGEAVLRTVSTLILAPQSEAAKVREYLYGCGYAIEAEDMVEEERKYYPMMRACRRKDGDIAHKIPEIRQMEYKYGPLLLKERHPVLLSYLKRERSQYRKVLWELTAQHRTPELCMRIEEVKTELLCLEKALAEMEGEEKADEM